MPAALGTSITVETFKKELLKIWRPHQRRFPYKIGLAISGGVDSMALAFLCKQLQSTEPLNFAFQAFVVDHGARPGSSWEAHRVSESIGRLEVQGAHVEIPTQVLTMQWPAISCYPLQSKKFETQARALRFQILGQAARTSDIDTILMAHHQDDQAETVLLRIAEGYTGAGLRGIKERAPIPHCNGIYGISEDARPIAASPIANLGIMVHRPLLTFNKLDLIQTCKKNRIPWFEDFTNNDPTQTVRNTVRHLLRAENLPRALQKTSLLALQDAICAKQQTINQAVAQFCQISTPFDFDYRSGKGLLRLPLSRDGILYNINFAEFLQAQDRENGLTELLAAIVRAVSPLSAIDQRMLRPIAYAMINDSKSQGALQSFTSAGIHWKLQSNDDPFIRVYSLVRQPYSRTEKRSSCSWSDEQSQGSWQLFDGRFWIQVSAPSRKIHAQAFSEDALRSIRRQLTKSSLNQLDTLLAKVAPGKSRWTLPLLLEEGTPLALPTLNFHFRIASPDVKWQVKYKAIPELLRKYGQIV